MAIYTPTYGGVPIFGAAVRMRQIPVPASQQAEAFFGVPGIMSVFGGHRGRTFEVTGILYDDDISLLNSDEDVFTPGVSGTAADGVARVLFDTRGRSWANVVCLGEYQPDPNGPVRGLVGGFGFWVLPYRAIFHGLS